MKFWQLIPYTVNVNVIMLLGFITDHTTELYTPHSDTREVWAVFWTDYIVGAQRVTQSQLISMNYYESSSRLISGENFSENSRQ